MNFAQASWHSQEFVHSTELVKSIIHKFFYIQKFAYFCVDKWQHTHQRQEVKDETIKQEVDSEVRGTLL